jgi:hypothetical protein
MPKRISPSVYSPRCLSKENTHYTTKNAMCEKKVQALHCKKGENDYLECCKKFIIRNSHLAEII